MHRGPITLAVVAAVALVSVESARAWSSRASQTFSEMHMLVNAIERFQQESGRYPEPATLHSELVEAGIWVPRNSATVFVDHWNHELIYRVPGNHGAFDLYSVGGDGIDNEGAEDDISNWAGVNDGYHWKQSWPRGRIAVAMGVALALGLLVSGRWIPWSIVLPISGIVLCVGSALGCHWLRHPGVVPDRNIPLELGIVAAAIGTVVLAVVLGFAIRRIRRAEQDTGHQDLTRQP